MNAALINHDCPPLMSDGRHATDYRPSCYVMDLIIKQNSIKNSHVLRNFMQNNGVALMKMNSDFFRAKNSCPSGRYTFPDPSFNDAYWANYQRYLGMRPN